MVYTFLLILILNMLHFDSLEARVYCEDSHALPWTPLGHSCPVQCITVVAAVDRLRMLEYKQIISIDKDLNHTVFDYSANSINIQEDFNEVRRGNKIPPNIITPYYNLLKTLSNKGAVTDLRNVFKMASEHFKNATCPFVMDKENVYAKECSRRSDIQRNFLKKFTEILNKYTLSEYPFTEELTAMILEKILGKNMDLRHGIFDVNKILQYLRIAIKHHKQHTIPRSDQVINLRPKYCLNLYVPGCFCMPGFVESAGQCVQPGDCLPETREHNDYLARIIVH